MKTYKAIALDFDGVILNSVPVKTRAFAELFKERPPEQIQRILSFHEENGGISRYVKFQHIYAHILGEPLSSEQSKGLGQRYSDIVLSQVLRAPLIPGALEFLKAAQLKWPLFVVSGTPQDELRDIVSRRDLSQYFEGVFGSPDEKHAILDRLLISKRIPPSEMIFVGDALTDWKAAQATGVDFIGVAPQAASPFAADVPRIDDLRGLTAHLSRT